MEVAVVGENEGKTGKTHRYSGKKVLHSNAKKKNICNVQTNVMVPGNIYAYVCLCVRVHPNEFAVSHFFSLRCFGYPSVRHFSSQKTLAVHVMCHSCVIVLTAHSLPPLRP